MYMYINKCVDLAMYESFFWCDMLQSIPKGREMAELCK